VDVRVRKPLHVLSQFLLIGWASVWITALPLFHTHLPGVFQQRVGLAHTVFSPDLPGEYRAFSHTTAHDETELSVLTSNSPELGFVASFEEDGKRNLLYERNALLFGIFTPPTRLASQRVQELPIIVPKTRWSPDTHGLRAPPAPVSL
jgi:hypothetical protein